MSDDLTRAELRAVLMSEHGLRVSTASVCEAILLELADLDDDDASPEWIQSALPYYVPVAMVRLAMRRNLADIAALERR